MCVSVVIDSCKDVFEHISFSLTVSLSLALLLPATDWINSLSVCYPHPPPILFSVELTHIPR